MHCDIHYNFFQLAKTSSTSCFTIFFLMYFHYIKKSFLMLSSFTANKKQVKRTVMINAVEQHWKKRTKSFFILQARARLQKNEILIEIDYDCALCVSRLICSQRKSDKRKQKFFATTDRNSFLINCIRMNGGVNVHET